MPNIVIILIAILFSTQLCAQSNSLSIEKETFLFEEGKHFAQCHASTLEETSNGNLLSSWFAGTHEGNNDVVIWGSEFDGNNWTEPTIWADGKFENKQYPCWNPVLFKPQHQNEIYLYYKVGPNPRQWWGMVKKSTDNGKSWSDAQKLPKGILGPIKNKPIELENGIILSPSSIELTENRWVAHIEKSSDQQKSWKTIPIDHTSEFNIIQPSILQHEDGTLQVLCRSREGKIISSFSKDKGENWSPLEPINLLNPNSATDAILTNRGFLIVYNPDIPGKEWWEGRTKLRLAHSNNGIDWIDVLTLENQDKGEYSYPTIFQDSKGKIHITYTYNRKNIKHIILS